MLLVQCERDPEFAREDLAHCESAFESAKLAMSPGVEE
jgi:hypothetical protein